MSAFRVLMVCTANHCRSPMAQQLLAHEAASHFESPESWTVESAGTDVRAPWPMHEYALTVLAERLAEVAPHHSNDLTPAAINRADLVLTAARQHRSIVVSMVPAALGRTFTILQFARLCTQVAPITGDDPGELGRQLVVQAKLARSSLQPVPVEDDDLADPMGRGIEDFRVCADGLQVAIGQILRPLDLGLPAASVAAGPVSAAPVAPRAVPAGAAGTPRPVPPSPRRLGRHRAAR
jgi:protein-tyrosine phosphatase